MALFLTNELYKLMSEALITLPLKIKPHEDVKFSDAASNVILSAHSLFPGNMSARSTPNSCGRTGLADVTSSVSMISRMVLTDNERSFKKYLASPYKWYIFLIFHNRINKINSLFCFI